MSKRLGKNPGPGKRESRKRRNRKTKRSKIRKSKLKKLGF